MTVASASGFPSSPFYIQIDSEIIQVTSGAGTTTWTISRPTNGTASSHANGATVYTVSTVTTAPPTSSNAYYTTAGNIPTGQLYVSGTIPSSYTGTTNNAVNNPTAVTIVGKTAYIVHNNVSNVGFIENFDISNPASIAYLSSASGNHGKITAISVAGQYLYALAANGGTTPYLDVYNISTPAMSYTGGIAPNTGSGNYLYSLNVSGGYLYITGVTASTSFITQISIANPASPLVVATTTLTGTCGLSSNSISSSIQGRYIYVACKNSNTLQIIDTNAFSTAPSSTSLATSCAPTSIATTSRYAYVVCSGTGALQVWDLLNPTIPTALSTGGYATGLTAPWSIVLSGRYAYIETNQSAGSFVGVFDISNPYNIQSLGQISIGSNDGTSQTGLAISGRYLMALNNNLTSNAAKLYDIGGEYTQSLESGSTDTQNLTVDNNEIIGGSSNIGSSLTVGQGANINGDLAVGGVLKLGNSSSTSTLETGCGTAQNYGTLYFNTALNDIRACVQNNNLATPAGNWSDLATVADLGILTYGILPDSGANPGD
jgi:hypothetical protein